MKTRINNFINQLNPRDLENWYRKLKHKKQTKGLTATQARIYKIVEDRLWFEFRV